LKTTSFSSALPHFCFLTIHCCLQSLKHKNTQQ